MTTLPDKGKILITGGNSMLALYLSRVMGERAILFDKNALDIRNTESFKALLESEKWAAVINTAGVYSAERKDLFDIHAFCSAQIALCCFNKNIPFVFVSTARVFDGKKKEGAYVESDQPNPLDDYGLSKYLGEHFIQNDGIEKPYYIFRLPMLLGERLSGKERQIVYRLIDLAANNKTVKVAGDVYHSPVSTMYAAQMISQTLGSRMPSGIYHITGNDHASLHDIVQRTFSLLDIKSSINKVSHDYFDGKTIFPRNMILSSEKLPAGPGWEVVVEQFVSEIRNRQRTRS